jgi:MoaA/NifB/PqqE/SkfB family radical SAM enzyme
LAVPLIQQIRVGAYVVKQQLLGRKRYPLVLMLEPLFRCNLACPGCGKIDYPDEILNRRLSVEDCVAAVEECGAPVVSIPGGEPLIHKDIGRIVEELIKRKRFVYLCTNALLLGKKLDLFKPTPIEEAHRRGFRVNVNCTLFDNAEAPKVAEFLNFIRDLGVEGVTISPGYAYERAPDQEHFLGRRRTKELFRDLFRLGKGRGWRFSQSSLFLDFLAGNQDYRCTPWSNPTRNVFGWQKPCYLLSEGYAPSFRALMEETDWDSYGTGNYEKCANCMVHCGYEGTAVQDTIGRPWKALKVVLKGIDTEGPMAPEISLQGQRPAEHTFEDFVAEATQRQPAEDQAGTGESRRAAE